MPKTQLILPILLIYQLIGDTVSHPSNHWSPGPVLDDLREIAVDWHQAMPDLPKLGINDGSLEMGGLFDISGHWRPKHQTHREGRDVDIRTKLGFMPTPESRAAFELIVNAQIGRNPELEEEGKKNEHFHIDF